MQAQESEHNIGVLQGHNLLNRRGLENSVVTSKMQTQQTYSADFPLDIYPWWIIVFEWQGWAASACTDFDVHDTEGTCL